MIYYLIYNGENYYSHNRNPFSNRFDPEFTRNVVNAKYFKDRTSAKEVLDKIKKIGITGYAVRSMDDIRRNPWKR